MTTTYRCCTARRSSRCCPPTLASSSRVSSSRVCKRAPTYRETTRTGPRTAMMRTTVVNNAPTTHVNPARASPGCHDRLLGYHRAPPRVISLWFRQHRGVARPQFDAAFTDSDRLGAGRGGRSCSLPGEAGCRLPSCGAGTLWRWHLVALTDAAFDLMGAIRRAADHAELVRRENLCQDRLDKFITAAGAQLR